VAALVFLGGQSAARLLHPQVHQAIQVPVMVEPQRIVGTRESIEYVAIPLVTFSINGAISFTLAPAYSRLNYIYIDTPEVSYTHHTQNQNVSNVDLLKQMSHSTEASEIKFCAEVILEMVGEGLMFVGPLRYPKGLVQFT
jgi:hypothetical protein